jgi:hypothetical protein
MRSCPECSGPVEERRSVHVDPDELAKEAPMVTTGQIETWEGCARCGWKSEPLREIAVIHKAFVRQQQLIDAATVRHSFIQ